MKIQNAIIHIGLAILFLTTHAYSADLTKEFKTIYHQEKDLTHEEQEILRKYDIHLIPGILAESLIWSDPRSAINFSLITKDYYHTQLKILNKKYKIPARRMTTSSYDVRETKQNIRQAIASAKAQGRKVLFVSHSLGGLALLEEMILNKSITAHVGGIAFLQSPFHGTPLGELSINPPYELDEVVAKIIPRLNISYDTLEFVSPPIRQKFMREHKQRIREFIKQIPIFTLTGLADSNHSIFKPLIDIVEDGCLKGVKRKCISDVFYHGPYDKSDGMIPFKSSFLENADFVILEKVDHGEIMLNVPFEDYKKEHLTTTIFRMLLQKISARE